MSLEDKVKQNTARVISLESDVNQLKVDTSKLGLTLDHQDERQQERFNVLSTAQMELKDIMKRETSRGGPKVPGGKRKTRS